MSAMYMETMWEGLGLVYHEPVMVDEVVEYLRPGWGKRFVDCTVGGGGHTRALLERGAEVLGMDRDGDALEEVGRELGGWGERLKLVRANFRRLGEVVREVGWGSVDGVLMDLGVSLHQLMTAERGFSFQRNGPLDMRMDRREGMTAADVVNTYSAEELARVFREYGEEPRAGRVAARIVEARKRKRLEETRELVEVVAGALRWVGGRNPATRIFQALRIEVNDELGALREALVGAVGVMRPGGRLVVISFHSLEDRIVKHFLREEAAVGRVRILTRGPLRPREEEVGRNPRSRSAKMRVAEKVGEGTSDN